MPPDCLFAHPLPENTRRITVACCETCRRAGEADEPLLRNILISTRESEKHPIAAKIAPKRDRSFQRSFSEVTRVLGHMTVADVRTKDGEIVPAWAFDLNSPLMNRFVLRVARSVLHEETGCGFFDCEATWALRPDEAMKSELLTYATTSRRVSAEFSYAGVFRSDEVNSAWLFTLYDSIDFLVSLFAKGNPPSAET